MTMRHGYLRRLRARQAAALLRDHVVFGLTAGWALLLIGCAEYFLVPGANDVAWPIAAAAGALILIVTLIWPAAFRPLRTGMMAAGTFISGAVFRGVLVVIYSVFIVPAGLWIRRRKGAHPFYSWTGAPPAVAEGWTPKEVPPVPVIRKRRMTTVGEAASTMQYFIGIRSYIYLPVLIALLVLGLILFMAQTSVLAPFIYTLF
jgi:hypothetical protein